MTPNDYRIFPDPTPSNDANGTPESQIKDVFIVVYHVDGNEMLCIRKSFMDVKNINLEELISKHPANNFSQIDDADSKSTRERYLGK
ncbi:MAG: hypothetical protein KA444_00755 [Bacteroidia bacterium]|nr:hypothetical protein [Bacteroidia bacterium]